MVDRLHAAGWVDRETDPSDRRSLLVTLTKDGRRVLAKDLKDLVPTIEKHVIAPLGTEVGMVFEALIRLRDAVNPEASGGGQASPSSDL